MYTARSFWKIWKGDRRYAARGIPGWKHLFSGSAVPRFAKFRFCWTAASGRYGILPSGGSTITCARSRLASALVSAIQMPRRSAPAFWDHAGPLAAVSASAKAKAQLMFLAGAGKMNLVTLSLDTVILNQLGAFGLTAQRDPQGPRPGIHRGILQS